MEIQKKYLNYVFHIEIAGLDHKLTRKITIDSNDTLASLAYIVLSSFNALSHHMYKINVKYDHDVCFTCLIMKEHEDKYIQEYLAKDYPLWKFNLAEGDVIEMDYGYGVNFHFFIQLIERKIEDELLETPKVISGVGYGVIEECSVDYLDSILTNNRFYQNIDYTKFNENYEQYEDNFKMLKLIYEGIKNK